jgi:hypothetical protein
VVEADDESNGAKVLVNRSYATDDGSTKTALQHFGYSWQSITTAEVDPSPEPMSKIDTSEERPLLSSDFVRYCCKIVKMREEGTVFGDLEGDAVDRTST